MLFAKELTNVKLYESKFFEIFGIFMIHFQDAIDTVRAQLDFEPAAISQVNLALYGFSEAVQPSLRQQTIKPHWIFALDNLIRSAVQAAVSILSPGMIFM